VNKKLAAHTYYFIQQALRLPDTRTLLSTSDIITNKKKSPTKKK